VDRTSAGAGRPSGLVAAGIFLSRLTGVARERVVGYFFGTGYAADAFTAASRIPNLLQNLLGEGVLSASMIPVYSRLLAEGRDDEAGKVAGAVAGLLAAAVGAVVVVTVALARPVTRVLAPGLDEETFELTVQLVRIITPGIGFLVLSAWCLAVLNSHRRFFLSYVAPVFMNVAQIAVLVCAGAVLLDGIGNRPSSGQQSSLVVWLAWGVVAGGALQFAVQLPTVLRVGPALHPSMRSDLPGVRQTLQSFVPIVAGRGVVHISGYLHLVLASFLALGALSALRYGQMLYMLPVSLFGMSVAAAELPELSSASREDPAGIRRRVETGMARIAFFVTPTVVAYLVIGDLLVGAVFQTGEFDRSDVVQVWVVLALHALGLLATTGSRLLQSTLYGIGEPRTPARVATVRVAVSLLAGVVLMLQLDHVVLTDGGVRVIGDLPAFSPLPEAFRDPSVQPDRDHLGAAGLSLAAALASWVEYRLLRRAVDRHVGHVSLGGGRLRPIVVASAVSGAAALVVRPMVAGIGPFAAGAIAAATSVGAYLTTASLLRIPEVDQLRRLHRRRRR
jgi:putative peptidoglycan lipid II flippase